MDEQSGLMVGALPAKVGEAPQKRAVGPLPLGSCRSQLQPVNLGLGQGFPWWGYNSLDYHLSGLAR